MTEGRAKTLMAAITSTLYDVSPNDWVGIGPTIYLALGMNREECEIICDVLHRTGLAHVESGRIHLTADGRKLGRQCSEIYARAASESVRSA